MSIWEKSDLVVNGRTIVAGTAEWESTIMARMDVTLAGLTAGAARLVVVTEAPPAPNPTPGAQQADTAVDDAGYARVNALLRRFAVRHPDQVTLVDLAGQLCPGGPPCPEIVAGMQARPDGRHFSPAAATWAARWILQQITEPGHL